MKKLLMPVWEGNISYEESAMAVANEDGSLSPIRMLYPIVEILEVKSTYLDVSYEAGKDYDVDENGNLVIPVGIMVLLMSVLWLIAWIEGEMSLKMDIEYDSMGDAMSYALV